MENRKTPILKGDTYCAPFCGAGCKKAAYDRAVKEAVELAAKMGDGWEPVVWENLGWHYKVAKGVAQIFPNMETGGKLSGKWVVASYTCYINSIEQFITKSADPVDALGFATHDARTAIKRIEAHLTQIAD